MSSPQGVFIDISGFRVARDERGKEFIVFIIKIRLGSFAWTVYRRFTQFRTLGEHLRRKIPDCAACPPKRVFGSHTNEFLEQRRMELLEWVRQLARDERVCRSPEFHEFLRAQANTPPAGLIDISSTSSSSTLSHSSSSNSLHSPSAGGGGISPTSPNGGGNSSSSNSSHSNRNGNSGATVGAVSGTNGGPLRMSSSGQQLQHHQAYSGYGGGGGTDLDDAISADSQQQQQGFDSSNNNSTGFAGGLRLDTTTSSSSVGVGVGGSTSSMSSTTFLHNNNNNMNSNNNINTATSPLSGIALGFGNTNSSSSSAHIGVISSPHHSNAINGGFISTRGGGVGGSSNSRKIGLHQFVLLKVVGKGSFGKVMQVRKRDTGRVYAMKVLTKANIIRRNQVEHTRTERNVLGKIVHPFIVGLNFAFQTTDKLYLVLDYCAGGELFFHLGREGRFDDDRARFYAAQIVLALQHLHSMNVIYRDLKPENVLLDHLGNVRLTDFGLSKENVGEVDSGAHSFCGTPEYLAPEVLNRTGHGRAVDWWSLGALLYEMLTGLPPFYCRDRNALFEKIRKGDLEYPDYLSEDARDLLTKLLTRDPRYRLGCGPHDAAELQSHPFFKSVDWEALYEGRIPAPWAPSVVGSMDTSQFDAEFTNMPIISPSSKADPVGSHAAKFFEGFTYVAPHTVVGGGGGGGQSMTTATTASNTSGVALVGMMGSSSSAVMIGAGGGMYQGVGMGGASTIATAAAAAANATDLGYQQQQQQQEEGEIIDPTMLEYHEAAIIAQAQAEAQAAAAAGTSSGIGSAQQQQQQQLQAWHEAALAQAEAEAAGGYFHDDASAYIVSSGGGGGIGGGGGGGVNTNLLLSNTTNLYHSNNTNNNSMGAIGFDGGNMMMQYHQQHQLLQQQHHQHQPSNMMLGGGGGGGGFLPAPHMMPVGNINSGINFSIGNSSNNNSNTNFDGTISSNNNNNTNNGLNHHHMLPRMSLDIGMSH